MPTPEAAPIVVVSGLPRSGTSLLMQMLVAGGVEAVSDGQRTADEDNPRGYLELEAVKGLQRDSSWVSDARGKAIKVISHLLTHLPPSERYCVVFVERDLEEVLASQAKMIARRGQPAPPEEVVRRAFKNHLAQFDGLAGARPEFDVLRVAYADAVAKPAEVAKRVAEFAGGALGGELDAGAMAAVVDPALYRNRRVSD